MNLDKQKIRLIAIVSVAVLLVGGVLFLLLRRPVSKPGEEKVSKTTRRPPDKPAKPVLSLHQLCRHADSIGIDTARYVTGDADRQTTRLLLEIRYGHRPAGNAFNGLPEQVDSAWAQQAPETFTAELMSDFTPYRQLVAHYNQLRRASASGRPVTDTLRQIRQTLNFYRYVNRFGGDQFVLVNIPAGQLNVFDRSGRRMLPMQVIAGKPDRQTPRMTTYIKDVVAYPYWNVPKSITQEEILPRMRKNPAYVYNQNMHILNAKGEEVDPDEVDWEQLSSDDFPYRVRQGTGCDNSLGLLKFDLVNPLAIYLHDTNNRELFTATKDRWRSHGCVRVEKPVELANLVLGKQAFDSTFIDDCQTDQKPQLMGMSGRFPVFIAYNTVDVDAAGKLRFYKDVYNLNGKNKPVKGPGSQIAETSP